jgi:pimeloyl-ACP methyl ester carboxylesterase
VKKRLRRIYYEGNEVSEQRLDDHHRPLRAANTHRSVLKTARRWDATRVQRDADDIIQPTLLMWGENDKDIPIANGYYMLNAMPNARMIVFKNCGHLPQEEWPREFVDVLTDFCRAKVPLERDRTYLIQSGS